MKSIFFGIFFLCIVNVYSQKDSLQLGDYYADDQIYVAVTYNQFINQPSTVRRSTFSYALSSGFMKDIILNKRGSVSMALGAGYGYSFFNHKLNVTETDNQTVFAVDGNVSNEVFLHNLELPFELRWRTSNAKSYSFWRIYVGLKTTYNLSNRFQFTDNNSQSTSFENINAFNQWQYGLTLSAGYDAFNIHFYYGLAPMYKDAFIENEAINTRTIKFGLIYYLL